MTSRLQIHYFYHGGGGEESIAGHLDALLGFGFNYCNDFACVTDESHGRGNCMKQGFSNFISQRAQRLRPSELDLKLTYIYIYIAHSNHFINTPFGIWHRRAKAVLVNSRICIFGKLTAQRFPPREHVLSVMCRETKLHRIAPPH